MLEVISFHATFEVSRDITKSNDKISSFTVIKKIKGRVLAEPNWEAHFANLATAARAPNEGGLSLDEVATDNKTLITECTTPLVTM